MIARPSQHRELARRLLEREAAVDASGDLVPATERLLRRVFVHLAGWFGPDSIHALMARSVAHARMGHSALANARIDLDGELRLRGIPSAHDREESAELRDALAALIAALFALLGRLIGEDMVARLLHQIWPGEVRVESRTTARADDPTTA